MRSNMKPIAAVLLLAIAGWPMAFAQGPTQDPATLDPSGTKPAAGDPAIGNPGSGNPGVGTPAGVALPTGTKAAKEPAAAPYEGTIFEGLEELTRLARDGSYEGALELSDSLLSPNVFMGWRSSLEEKTGAWSERLLAHFEGPLQRLGFETARATDRAEVHYVRGWVRATMGAFDVADESYELSRALAGEAGATRDDAVYNLGTIDFLVGEVTRSSIPEIAAKAGVPVPPPASGPPGAGEEEAPDPLELARAAYMAAREHYIERLRLDWQDADARANTELVIRRLRELDEIEKQREEQEQEQQDQQNDEDKEQSDDQQDSEDKQDSEEEQDPSEDPEDSDEEKSDEEQDSEEEQDEEQDSEEQDSEEEQDENAKPDSEEEQYMTAEEALRLMKMLEEQEKEAEKIKAQLRRSAYQGTKRDW